MNLLYATNEFKYLKMNIYFEMYIKHYNTV